MVITRVDRMLSPVKWSQASGAMWLHHASLVWLNDDRSYFTQLRAHLGATEWARGGIEFDKPKELCTTYGYTVVRKGTSTQRWNMVSREADVYQVLRQVQGSAVPVFLGKIDLAKVYFLHWAGEIRHMLIWLLGVGGVKA